jgi:two-component system, NarL family, response regulator DesR
LDSTPIRERQQITVLLVDDQRDVRCGLRMLLELEPGLVVVGEAATGPLALAAADLLLPDVAIVDVELGGMDGIAVTEQLRTRHPACAVIILTIHDDVHTRARATAAGAKSFVAKGAPAALRSALRACLNPRPA